MRSEGIPCLQSHIGSVIKVIQPTLDVLSQNAKCPFSKTHSVVSNVQNNVNALLFLHGVLCQGHYLTHAQSAHGRATFAPTI